MFSFAPEKKQNKWEKLPGLRTLPIEYHGLGGGGGGGEAGDQTCPQCKCCCH